MFLPMARFLPQILAFQNVLGLVLGLLSPWSLNHCSSVWPQPLGCQGGVQGDGSLQTFVVMVVQLSLSFKPTFLLQLCDTGAGPLLTTFLTWLPGGGEPRNCEAEGGRSDLLPPFCL